MKKKQDTVNKITSSEQFNKIANQDYNKIIGKFNIDYYK
jgi:hypothetical protein